MKKVSASGLNINFDADDEPAEKAAEWFCTSCLRGVMLSVAAANDVKDASNTDIVELMTTPGHGKRQCPKCLLRAVVPYTVDELTKYIQAIQDTIRHNDTLKKELKRMSRLHDQAQHNVTLLQRHVEQLEERASQPIVKITDTAEIDRLTRRVAELERMLGDRGVTVPDGVRRERGLEF